MSFDFERFMKTGQVHSDALQNLLTGLSDKYLGTNYQEQQAADVAWERQLQLLNMQNEYNTPANQMQRAREAGLNPSLVYGQPISEAASGTVPQAGQGRGSANGIADILSAMMVKSQIDNIKANTENLRADAAKKREETKYQQYMNNIEEQLAHVPIRSVITRSDDGQEEITYTYGNARVELTQRELHNLGLSGHLLTTQINELLFNLAVLSGSDYYGNNPPGTIAPSETPGYESAVAGLKGDQAVRDLSAQLYRVSLDAAKAEKQGYAEFNDWIEKHKDSEIVQLMLVLTGLLRSVGITAPSMSFKFSNGG